MVFIKPTFLHKLTFEYKGKFYKFMGFHKFVFLPIFSEVFYFTNTSFVCNGTQDNLSVVNICMGSFNWTSVDREGHYDSEKKIIVDFVISRIFGRKGSNARKITKFISKRFFLTNESISKHCVSRIRLEIVVPEIVWIEF